MKICSITNITDDLYYKPRKSRFILSLHNTIKSTSCCRDFPTDKILCILFFISCPVFAYVLLCKGEDN